MMMMLLRYSERHRTLQHETGSAVVLLSTWGQQVSTGHTQKGSCLSGNCTAKSLESLHRPSQQPPIPQASQPTAPFAAHAKLPNTRPHAEQQPQHAWCDSPPLHGVQASTCTLSCTHASLPNQMPLLLFCVSQVMSIAPKVEEKEKKGAAE